MSNVEQDMMELSPNFMVVCELLGKRITKSSIFLNNERASKTFLSACTVIYKIPTRYDTTPCNLSSL